MTCMLFSNPLVTCDSAACWNTQACITPKTWEYNLSHVATIFPGRLWFLSVGTTTHDSQQSMAPAAVDLTTEDLLPCPAGTYEEGWRSTYGRGNIWNISNTILLFPLESTRIWILDFGNQRIWDGNQWIWGPWVGKHAFQLTWTIWTKVQWDRSGNRCQWAFLPFLPFLRREIAATRRLLVGQLRFGGFGGTVGGAKPWCAGGPGGPGAHGSLLDPHKKNGRGMLGHPKGLCWFLWFLCYCSMFLPYLWCFMWWGFWDYFTPNFHCWCLDWRGVGFV